MGNLPSFSQSVMTITKVLPIFILSFISVVEPKAQSIYPFEAEARLITEPIVNGAVALEDFIGDIVSPLLQPQFSGDKGNQQAYDAAPKPVKIPCGDYGSKRRSLLVGALTQDTLSGDKGKDDCGVYKETDKPLESEETCEYVHETVFVTKYKTECSKTYSTQCQTSYKTECTSSLNRECRTEYQEECSIVDTEECVTVDRPTYHQVCDTEYVQNCDGGGYQSTYEAPPPCATVPKQVCRQVAEFHQETECTNVPKKSCVTSPREVCGDVPKQDCKLTPTSTNCKDIPEKLCRQRAYQYPESITRQVCGLGPSQPSGGKKGKKGRK